MSGAGRRRARNALAKCPGYEPNPTYMFLERCKNCGFSKGEHDKIVSEGGDLFSYLGLEGQTLEAALSKTPIVKDFLPGQNSSNGLNYKVTKREADQPSPKPDTAPPFSSDTLKKTPVPLGRDQTQVKKQAKRQPEESAKPNVAENIVKRLSKRLSRNLSEESAAAAVTLVPPNTNIEDAGNESEQAKRSSVGSKGPITSPDAEPLSPVAESDDKPSGQPKDKARPASRKTPMIRIPSFASEQSASFQKAPISTTSAASSMSMKSDMQDLKRAHLEQIRVLMNVTKGASQAAQLQLRRYEEPSRETLKLLANPGGSIRLHGKPSIGWNKLHVAAWNRDLKLIEKLAKNSGLQARGIDLDGLTGNTRETALSLSVKRGQGLDCARCLIDAGADASLADAFGFTPLHYAVRTNDPAMITLLMEDGKASCRDVTAEFSLSAVHLAARYADTPVFELLLDRSGVDVNVVDKRGWNPLCYAAMRRGKSKLVRYLLDKGANALIAGAAGITVMHCAVLSDDTDIVTMLIEAGARMDVKDAKGWTPVHYTAFYNAAISLRTLLEFGARTVPKAGSNAALDVATPYEIAISNNKDGSSSSNIELLLENARGFVPPAGDRSHVNCHDSCLAAYERIDEEMDFEELENIQDVLYYANKGNNADCCILL